MQSVMRCFAPWGLQGWSTACHALLNAFVCTFNSANTFSPEVFVALQATQKETGPVVMLLFLWCWGRHFAAAAAPGQAFGPTKIPGKLVHQVASSLRLLGHRLRGLSAQLPPLRKSLQRLFDLEVSVKNRKTWFWSSMM